MRNISDISRFIRERPAMVRALDAVATLGLPDAWIGAGFIRNTIWDALHGVAGSFGARDVDVVFFDALVSSAEYDLAIQTRLAGHCPEVPWSIRNQARMHVRNGDAPYVDAEDGIRHWPETATAIAARWRDGFVEVIAPHGVSDLLGLIVRPTPAFRTKIDIVRHRVREKGWLSRWPRLILVDM
jgi:uncharacterized protein